MRKTAALVLAIGMMASLAACSSTTSDGAAAACTPAKSGSASDSVTVTGKIGAKPTVKVDAPVTATTDERTVVTKGDGAKAVKGNSVSMEYTLLNGDTGEVIYATSYDGSDASPATLGSMLPIIDDTLLCSTVGSRVVGVGPAAGMAPEAQEQLNLTDSSTLVIVADVVSAETPTPTPTPTPLAELPKADGADQPLPAGFPAITVSIADDATGTPTVTIPDAAPPADLQLAVLKKGTGAVVTDGERVAIRYDGTNWTSKAVFDSSWVNGVTTQIATSVFVKGFQQALVGQTVGSQVLVTIPPSLGYGDTGNASAGISGTDTIVFLIDILGAGE